MFLKPNDYEANFYKQECLQKLLKSLGQESRFISSQYGIQDLSPIMTSDNDLCNFSRNFEN